MSSDLTALAEKLFANCTRDENGCFIWQAGVTTGGYGHLRWRGKNIGTHRAALMIKLGRDIAPGMQANHICIDQRRCCRPGHVYEGTPDDNMKDKANAGRAVYTSGEECGSSWLSEAQVQEIRWLLFEGRLTQRQIAELYGVSRATPGDIKTKKSWAYLPEPDYTVANAAEIIRDIHIRRGLYQQPFRRRFGGGFRRHF
jgi:hypothetical protein